MVEASGNTPELNPEITPERGIEMAIAINNFPVAAVARRNMAPVYRRRRAVVSLVLAALAVTVSFAMLDTSAVAERPTAENLATPKFVIAESGDTLWAIAQRIAPNSDITEVVDQLVLMNGDQITTGQLVRIP
jgi:nucleoid-associated protein YgaU